MRKHVIEWLRLSISIGKTETRTLLLILTQTSTKQVLDNIKIYFKWEIKWFSALRKRKYTSFDIIIFSDSWHWNFSRWLFLFFCLNLGKAKNVMFSETLPTLLLGPVLNFWGYLIFLWHEWFTYKKQSSFLPTCIPPLRNNETFPETGHFCGGRAKLNLNEMHFLNYMYISKDTLLVRTTFLIGNNGK